MDAQISLEALGLSADALAERIVERAAEQLLTGVSYDEDGRETVFSSNVARKIEAKVKEAVDEAVARIAEKHILPNVAAYVENLTLQETNAWGEKRGQPVTFIEYLVARAENYLNEPVDFRGKTKAEEGYNWAKAQTRITYLVNSHLQYSIETAMKQALAVANSAIAGGITEAVKIKLEEVVKGLKVQVATK